MKGTKYSRAIRLLTLLLGLPVLLCACAGNGGNTGADATPGPDKSNVITVKPADSTIGIWYSVWYNYTSPGSNSNKDIWKSWDIQYKPLLPDGTYGYYDSIDEEVIRYHLKEMTGAGISFIIMDQTNHIDVEGGFINDRALKVAEVIHKWNQEGNKPIYYCSAIGAIQWTPTGDVIEEEARKLYTRYCKKDFGEDYFMLEGKPLLIVYGDGGNTIWEKYKAEGGRGTSTEKFTLRFADNQSRPGYYGWAYDKGTQIDEEVSVVMPGWDNRKGAKPVPRDHGKWYRESWEVLLKSDIKPKMVVINSFNEYAENTGVFTALTDLYGDDAPDMYWNMTKDYIKLYKEGGEYELGGEIK